MTLEDIDALFCTAEWGGIVRDATEEWTDPMGRFTTLSMLRALALPFLLPIASERSLARELEEKRSLAALCGFLGGSVPSRAVFWHFRDHASRVYTKNMPRVLVILALAGLQLEMPLPFVNELLPEAVPTVTPSMCFQLSCSRMIVRLWQMGQQEGDLRTGAGSRERLPLFPDEVPTFVVGPEPADGLLGGLGMPLLVRISDGENVRHLLRLVEPGWLDFRRPVTDPLSGIVPSVREVPYVVVHAIVTRGIGDTEMILMGSSISGSAKGTYTLPGGTLQNGERLIECLVREVGEETGLTVEESVPVSFFFTQFEQRPWVLNVVAKVGSYTGKLENREVHNFDSWAWLPKRDIPNRLTLDVFRPALIAIRHYRRNNNSSLTWKRFDEDVTGTVLGKNSRGPQGAVPFSLWEESRRGATSKS